MGSLTCATIPVRVVHRKAILVLANQRVDSEGLKRREEEKKKREKKRRKKKREIR